MMNFPQSFDFERFYIPNRSNYKSQFMSFFFFFVCVCVKIFQNITETGKGILYIKNDKSDLGFPSI
jgi:hypothetical protein